jgi:hypothetical protein
MIWTRLSGGILLAIGIALLIVGFTLVHRQDWRPVDLPLPLKAGNRAEASFRSAFSATYLVYLTVESGKNDWTHIRCLLGVEIPPDLCQNTPSVVDVSWVASTKSATLGHGDSREWLGTRGGFGRLIGTFQAERDIPCTFSITVNRDGSELNALNPRVTVEPDDRILEDYLITAALLKVFGAMAVIIGLILLSLAFLKHSAKKRT